MIQPCKCSGTAANVHAECLERWLRVSGRTSCEICKYEYQIEEMTEAVCVICPTMRIGEDRYTRNLLIIIGFLFFFNVPTFALVTEEPSLDIFLLVNFMQCLMLLCMISKKVRPLETLFVWKIMSSVAFAIGVLTYPNYEYAYLEWGITCCLGILTYLSLVREVRKYNIIYIENYISA